MKKLTELLAPAQRELESELLRLTPPLSRRNFLRHIFGHRPCKAVGCKDLPGHPKGEVRDEMCIFLGITFAVSSVCVFALKIPHGLLDETVFMAAGLGFVSLGFFAGCRWISSIGAWRDHKQEIEAARQKVVALGLTDRLLNQLKGELTGEREAMIGAPSKLATDRETWAAKLQEVRTLREQLKSRAARRDGEIAAELTADEQSAEALIVKLEADVAALDTHIARIGAFYKEREHEIDAMRDPLEDFRIRKELREHLASAEAQDGAVERTIAASVIEWRERTRQLRERITAMLTEMTAEQFALAAGADGPAFDGDLRLLNRTLDRALKPLPAPGQSDCN